MIGLSPIFPAGPEKRWPVPAVYDIDGTTSESL